MAIARPSLVPPSHNQSLIERDEPLAALSRALDEASAGAGRFVVIRGEAGIGKTALMRHFVRSCPPAITVFAGSCDGVSTPQPFGPLEDMVSGLGPDLRALLDANATRGEVGRWLLNRLSDGSPHVLAFEDIQWADEATLELLAYLARRLETLPILILVTHREDDAAATSVARILGSLASLPVVRQMSLEPLSATGVRRLAGGRQIDVGELFRITSGNPFYVSEVLQAATEGIPVSVLDAVRARVARLDARARRALDVAAIIGIRSEPWLVAAIAGEDLIGIDDCFRVGLLTKADGITFRHELTRMAVLEDLPVIRGIALHRQALAALERAGIGDDARLAYHAEGAADRSAVLRHATAAGRRALAMGALQQAAAQFERALRSADGMDADGRAELLEASANVLSMINHLPEAFAACTEAVALRRQVGDIRKIATDLSTLALIAWVNGRGEESWSAAREAVALLESSGDSKELGMAYATLGRVALSAGVIDVARTASQRALEIGRRLDNAMATATALATIGTIGQFEENSGEGRESLEESLRIGRHAHLPEIVDRALNNLGNGALAWRRLEEAEELFRELEEHSERSEIERCSVDEPRAEIALALGNWAAAERHAHAAFNAPRTDPIDHALAMILLARLAVRRGDEGWQQWLVEPKELVARLDTNQLRWPLAALAAEQAWLAGDMTAVLPDVRRAYDEASARRERWAIGELGRWLWLAGQLPVLDDLVATPYALEVAGRVREAAAEWERLGIPYEAALCLADSADATDVRRAHAILTELGATAVAGKVARRLRELGTPVPRGPRPTTRANPGGLTEREAEIARFVAEGLSNAEIAERLVLSPRTVGHHVSAVLAKLDVPRRSAVAAAIGAAEVST